MQHHKALNKKFTDEHLSGELRAFPKPSIAAVLVWPGRTRMHHFHDIVLFGACCSAGDVQQRFEARMTLMKERLATVRRLSARVQAGAAVDAGWSTYDAKYERGNSHGGASSTSLA